ncbi:MAG: DNA double-strand break repair nuclease NurA [Dehalococcoidales bacterium]|nr:DNA double-strand break repair nuclease NurA [Dehalococcoidales bacterium]
MPLDISKVAGEVFALAHRMRERHGEREEAISFALKTMHEATGRLEGLKQKVAASRTTYLVAEIVEGLGEKFAACAVPIDFTVIATDGSHIDVDRHQAARCYLINTGSVVMRYGTSPAARLASTPRFYGDEADLEITPPGGGRGQAVEGTLLGIKRAVEELRALLELAGALPAGTEVLGLLDGSLILWGLEAYPEFVADVLVGREMVGCLDGMKEIARRLKFALASYISYPRSTDVVNLLRVAVCPVEAADCDRLCPPGKERACDRLSGLRDRDLFFRTLLPGERSALFASRSQIVRSRYGVHRIHFYYLHTGDEIARVEVPAWVAEDRGLLELSHALILDQCRRGQGYPVALMEAHEQAVLSTRDRENFRSLLESALAEARLPLTASGKSTSKRIRWL